jgi:ABC-type polysaccharide/polyol phosphate transport system ATPase subunit
MSFETPKAHSVASAPVAGPRDEIAVAVRDLGKCYGIYPRPMDRLKRTLWRGRRRFCTEFWALRNVSFDLRRGEAIGVIGRNGSGKSTLLQMIAGTLRPTEGEIEVRGRVAAMLELGSGFNPEFTGRENIYLNGSILGLSISEIDRRFDEIAAFADIGAFLDQPVKTYSTGMLVRVAFAVQTVLEPDVLIVDEALAVGDAAFQIKCMTRMSRLLDQGVSVILVTHDVNAVRMFCHRAIWLEEGRVREIGSPREVTSQYLQFLLGDPAGGSAEEEIDEPSGPAGGGAATPGASGKPAASSPARLLMPVGGRRDLVRWGSGEVRIEAVAMDNGIAGRAPVFEYGDRLHIEMEVRAVREVDSPNVGVGFALRNTKGLDIITFTSWEAGHRIGPLRSGAVVRLRFELENILAPGEYALVLNVEDVRGNERHYFDFVENAVLFQVVGGRRIFSCVLPPVHFERMEADTTALRS